MATIAQMTVDAAYRELAKLSGAGQAERDALNAQKLELQSAYSRARAESNAVGMKFLEPLIHKNSQLRLQYRDLAAKFNGIVNGVASLLRRARLTVPQLSGLGLAPAAVIVPAVYVLGLIAAWDIVRRLTNGRQAIDRVLQSDGPRLLAIASDTNRPADERKAALDSYNELMKKAGVDFMSQIKDVLVPVAFVVAAIVLGPPLLEAFKGRRARA